MNPQRKYIPTRKPCCSPSDAAAEAIHHIRLYHLILGPRYFGGKGAISRHMTYHIPIESSSSPLFNNSGIGVISNNYWLIKCAQHNRIQVDWSINVALYNSGIGTVLHRHQVSADSILDQRFDFNSAIKRAVLLPAKTVAPKLGNTVL